MNSNCFIKTFPELLLSARGITSQLSATYLPTTTTTTTLTTTPNEVLLSPPGSDLEQNNVCPDLVIPDPGTISLPIPGKDKVENNLQWRSSESSTIRFQPEPAVPAFGVMLTNIGLDPNQSLSQTNLRPESIPGSTGSYELQYRLLGRSSTLEQGGRTELEGSIQPFVRTLVISPGTKPSSPDLPGALPPIPWSICQGPGSLSQLPGALPPASGSRLARFQPPGWAGTGWIPGEPEYSPPRLPRSAPCSPRRHKLIRQVVFFT